MSGSKGPICREIKTDGIYKLLDVTQEEITEAKKK